MDSSFCLEGSIMKATDSGIRLPAFLPKLSHDKQVLALKLIILSIAVILCEYYPYVTCSLFIVVHNYNM